MAKFNQRLQELRRKHQLSQQSLADRLGLSKSSVNMYERGEREPGLDTLDALATFFGVSMDYLMGRTAPPAVPSPAPPEAIGHRIRAARESHGMTQEDLAQKMGYRSKSTINKIEKGINDIPRAKVAEFAHVLGVSAVSLMGLDPAPAVPSPAPSEAIGHRIRAARESHGMTMKDIAAAAGVSEGTVSRWESGDIENMKQNRIQAIAAALHVSPAYLMGIEDAATDPALSRLAAQLNAAGRDKLIAYAEDLVLSGRYAKEDE